MEDKYLQDISDIKNMMHKSSQFISLSGFAGVLAGVYALVGAFAAKIKYDSFFQNHSYSDYTCRPILGISTDALTINLFIIAILVLAASIITAFVLTYFKAKKQNETILNPTSKRLAVNFLIPLFAGGIFAIQLLRLEYYSLIAPITLIFYGFACVNASKYTFRDVRYLGITMTILGLICTEYSGYALQFWALGFGVCHIVYGGLMWFKYDRG
jgi:general stress protein CsbA